MNKILAILAALALVFTLFVPMAAAQNIPTSAVVSGAGTPPVIETIFVLNDNGDPLPNHGTFGTQIMPTPGSGALDVNTYFMKYVIVSDPNGATDISKVEEWLTKADGVDTPLVTTTEVLVYPDEVAILDDALAQNVINVTEYNSAKFKLDPAKNSARMFKVQNSVNNHDKPGQITVHFKAIDKSGGTAFLTEEFTLRELKAFETDFTQINYQTILVNVEQYIAGDDYWAVPGLDGTMRNTVKNQGNVEFQISAQASAMSNGATPAQYIQPAALSIELLGEHIWDLTAEKTLIGKLQPCTPTQISFDIKAPEGTSAGTYSGTLSLKVK
jgi:hypothetical protein